MFLKAFLCGLLLTTLSGCALGGSTISSAGQSEEVANAPANKQQEGQSAPFAPEPLPLPQESGRAAPQEASPVPRTTGPTAELLPRDPPTTLIQGAGLPPLPDFNLPPESWAKEELARRSFVKDRTKKLVVLDPGHGGPEVGAAQGRLGEKTINLQIAHQLQGLLEAEGYQVLLTRETDQRAYTLADELSLSPRNPLRADLQGRVDLANAAQADIFVSIHNNGSGNRAEAGTEVWYAPDRPLGAKNWLLAQEVQSGILAELSRAGYNSPNRGLKNGSQFRVFQGRVFPLFVLGNPRTEPRPTRATQMPGILGESLFVSNPHEASLLVQEKFQLAIAKGYKEGIVRYFALTGG